MKWPETSAEELYEQFGPNVAGPVLQRVQSVRDAEPSITSDVLASLPEGTRPESLEHRVKSPASLARKVASRRSKASVEEESASRRYTEETLGQTTDVVRYTVVSRSHDRVLDDAQRVVSSLQERGWTVVEADQSYQDGAMYKGLHFLARHPSGETVELQAHSEESMKVKAVNHRDYEVLRDSKRPPAERQAAQDRMLKRSAGLSRPKGLTSGATLGGVPIKIKNR